MNVLQSRNHATKDSLSISLKIDLERLYPMTYAKKAIRGAGITFIMSMFAVAVSYLFRIVLARSLGPEDFGLFYSVFTFVIFFLFFRDLGLSPALVKSISEFRAQGKNGDIKSAISFVLGFQLISSLVIGSIFFILSDYLAQHYFQNQDASLMLKLLVVYILGSIFFIVLKGTFNGFQKMFLFSSVELAKNSFVLLFALLFLRLGYGALAPALAYVAVCAALFLLYLPFALRTFSFFTYKITDFQKISRRVLFFGIPLFAVSVADKVIGYIDTLLLTYFRSLTEVGIYNVVLPSSLILLYVGSALSVTLFPLVTELWTKKDISRLCKGIDLIYRNLYIVVIPAIFTIFAFAPEFLVSFFGEDYKTGSYALQILLVGVLFFTLAIINNSIISGTGKPRMVAKITFLSAFANVIFNIALIPSFGINGAAFATALSYALSMVLSTIFLKKDLSICLPASIWLKQFFAAIVFIFTIYLTKEFLPLNSWPLFVSSFLLAMIVYLSMLLWSKALNIKELKKYTSLLR